MSSVSRLKWLTSGGRDFIVITTQSWSVQISKPARPRICSAFGVFLSGTAKAVFCAEG